MGASFSLMRFPRRRQHSTECRLTFSRNAREGGEWPSATDEEAPHAEGTFRAVGNAQWIVCADPSGCLYMRNISNGLYTYQLQIPESAMNVSPVRTTSPVQDMDPTGLLVSPCVARANTDRDVRASFPPLDLPEPAADHRIHEVEAIARHHRHPQQHQQQQWHQQRQRHQREQEDWSRTIDETDWSSCSHSVAGYSQYEEDPYDLGRAGI